MRTDFNISEKILEAYKKDIRRYKLLTGDEEKLLAKRIRNGDKKAIKELVMANLSFVIDTANDYKNQGLPILDLINSGNLGLIAAAKKFDDRKNFKFITYAVWYIKAYIRRALMTQARTIRISEHGYDKMTNFKKMKDKLSKKAGKNISFEEAHMIMGTKNSKYIDETSAINTPCVSLDSLNELGYPLIDSIKDEEAATDRDTILESEKEQLDKCMSKLDSMQKKVIKEFYGLGATHEKTLAGIGKKYKLSRERIRQIHDSALKILRKKYYKISSY
jgi:RNA polymerase primary sigma factor